MKKVNWIQEGLLFGLMISPAILTALFWNQIPAEVPIHWNIKGEVDGYGPKWTLALLSPIIWALTLFLPMIDPKKKNYELFETTYFKFRLILIGFFALINVLIVMQQIGLAIDLNRMVIAAICLMFAALGNYFAKLRPNWFIGIRTPWTLDNETVWIKTHRVGGRIWVAIGLLCAVAVWFFFSPAVLIASFVLLIGSSIGIIAYSWWLHRGLETTKTATKGI